MTKTCACCEGPARTTPTAPANRPGLDEIAYRAGIHATFLETMIAALSDHCPGDEQECREGGGLRPLRRLTTRQKDDPAIAWLDAWAALADVLTFYQERLANEGFLRTANQRRSVLELARLVGYRLRPGVAASVYLAFSLEKDHRLTLPQGLRAQSMPGPGELPQAFETSAALEARAEWNQLAPRRSRSLYITEHNLGQLPRLYLQGSALNLNVGDPLLFCFQRWQSSEIVTAVSPPITAIDADLEAGITVADLKPIALPAALQSNGFQFLDHAIIEEMHGLAEEISETFPGVSSTLIEFIHGETDREQARRIICEVLETLHQAGTLKPSDQPVDPEIVQALIHRLERIETRIRNTEFDGMLQALALPPSRQPAAATALARQPDLVYSGSTDLKNRVLTRVEPALAGSLHGAWRNAAVSCPAKLCALETFRVKASLFGHNAPRHSSFSEDNIQVFREWKLEEDYGVSGADVNRQRMALDAEYAAIAAGSHVYLTAPNTAVFTRFPAIYRVSQVNTIGKTAYGMTGQFTELVFAEAWLADHVTDLAPLRGVTVHAAGKALQLADEPITRDVAGDRIELDDYYEGLTPGRWVVITGERTDTPATTGVMGRERAMIAAVEEGPARIVDNGITIGLPGDKNHTTLVLAEPLAYTYKRDTVVVHGNVVKATHGETRAEVLGSGDGKLARQSFTLKQKPLTHTSAATATGTASSLTVRVDGVRWPETDNLIFLDAADRGYITATDDADQTTITFGDGSHGARLPSGIENIKAVYRSGIGSQGNVAADKITTLAQKPLGVKEVINPLAASGGADRENRDQARRNVPLAVKALDRLVSVADYTDFARTFGGVGKARSAKLSDGRRQWVHLTIAGAANIPIDPDSDLFANLGAAVRRLGDPHTPLWLDVYEPILLAVLARVKLHEDVLWADVEPRIRAELYRRFGFDNRRLGQDLQVSQLLGAIQGTAGVVYVDLDLIETVRGNQTAQLTGLIAKLESLAEAVGDPGPSGAVPSPKFIEVPCARRVGDQLQPAALAFLDPSIPDLLILQEVTA